MLRDSKAVAFRCLSCAPGPAAIYDLGNPSFVRLFADVVRPAAILTRAARWSSGYFGRGAGEAECTRCRRPVRLSHRRAEDRRGLHGECRRCGETVWSSVRGLALTHPEARAFQTEHARVRTLPERDLEYRGADATLVPLEAASGRAALDVVFARETLRVLAVH